VPLTYTAGVYRFSLDFLPGTILECTRSVSSHAL
jgi:hypothetical protein